jgi:hypothetical protein
MFARASIGLVSECCRSKSNKATELQKSEVAIVQELQCSTLPCSGIGGNVGLSDSKSYVKLIMGGYYRG